MQYKIPQNVGIEDKIVGPLTLRQLIIIAVGIGISYVFFALLTKIYELNILEYAVIALPGMLAIAFALVKINDIPLLKYLFLLLEFSIKPKKRVWDHRGISSLVAPELTEAKKETEAAGESLLEIKAKKAANLRELTQTLDSGGFEHVREVEHEDMDATYDDDLVTQAYFGNKRSESETENMYWRTKESHKKLLDVFASMPVTPVKKSQEESAALNKAPVQTQSSATPQAPKPTQTQPVTPRPAPPKPVSTQPTASKPVPPKPAMAKTTPPKPLPPKQSGGMQKPPSGPAGMPGVQGPVGGNTKKRPKKRNRNLPQPVRGGNINNTNKNKPAEYIPENSPQKPAQPQPQKPQTGKTGEFDIRELEKGEIEINLD